MSTTYNDEESSLQSLESEKQALEQRPHDGFADAVREVRLNSEIEALEQRIAQNKQHGVPGEG